MIYGRLLLNLVSFVQDNIWRQSLQAVYLCLLVLWLFQGEMFFRLDLQHSFNTDSSSTPEFVVCFCFVENRTTL